jgi:hypothetical protein
MIGFERFTTFLDLPKHPFPYSIRPTLSMACQAHQYIYAKNKKDLEDLITEHKRQQKIFSTPEGKIIKAKLDAERRN